MLQETVTTASLTTSVSLKPKWTAREYKRVSTGRAGGIRRGVLIPMSSSLPAFDVVGGHENIMGRPGSSDPDLCVRPTSRMDMDMISSRHCSFIYTDGVMQFSDHSKNGSFVNGEKPEDDCCWALWTTAVPLEDGDEIVLQHPDHSKSKIGIGYTFLYTRTSHASALHSTGTMHFARFEVGDNVSINDQSVYASMVGTVTALEEDARFLEVRIAALDQTLIIYQENVTKIQPKIVVKKSNPPDPSEMPPRRRMGSLVENSQANALGIDIGELLGLKDLEHSDSSGEGEKLLLPLHPQHKPRGTRRSKSISSELKEQADWIRLLKAFKLDKFRGALENDGYYSVQDCIDIQDDELFQDYGFGKGHLKAWKRMLKENHHTPENSLDLFPVKSTPPTSNRTEA